MVNINLNIQKKDLWLLSAIMVFLVGVAVVVAYGSGDSTVHGHDAGEIGIDFFVSNYIDDGDSTSYSFTPARDGIAVVVAKGNFGTSCGAGTGGQYVQMSIDGSLGNDKSYSYVHDNHCGSRTFTLIEEFNVLGNTPVVLVLTSNANSRFVRYSVFIKYD